MGLTFTQKVLRCFWFLQPFLRCFQIFFRFCCSPLMCWCLPAILCWVYCSPASVGVFAAVILVSIVALFRHLLSAISGASHWHLLVALDHGILELTLSLLLLLCRTSSSSSRFICLYTPSWLLRGPIRNCIVDLSLYFVHFILVYTFSIFSTWFF